MKRSKPIDRARGRRTDSRDVEVAHRVRARRFECRLSQTDLAKRLGVTARQVQKYEKGVNRIGAGSLQRIADALDVPITFFFGSPFRKRARSHDRGSESLIALLQTSGAVRLITAYQRIRNRKAKQTLVDLTEEFAKQADAKQNPT